MRPTSTGSLIARFDCKLFELKKYTYLITQVHVAKTDIQISSFLFYSPFGNHLLRDIDAHRRIRDEALRIIQTGEHLQ